MKEHDWNQINFGQRNLGDYFLTFKCAYCGSQINVMRSDIDQHKGPYKHEVKEKDCNIALAKKIMEQ